MIRLLLASVLCAPLLLAGAAHAGPVQDFEAALRSAYADYRVALFQTNAGGKEAAVKAIGAFEAGWTGLMAAAPPPQYAGDADYGTTGARVAELAAAAAAEAEAGKLAEAHETLEGIRDEIGALHERNGIVGFSDRMNAYHAEMEAIIGKDYGGFDAAGLATLREDAAVLAYLAAGIANHPPAEFADPAYAGLVKALTTSVEALQAAARAGDAAAARKAVGSLKVPYSKLFLKFG